MLYMTCRTLNVPNVLLSSNAETNNWSKNIVLTKTTIKKLITFLYAVKKSEYCIPALYHSSLHHSLRNKTFFTYLPQHNMFYFNKTFN